MDARSARLRALAPSPLSLLLWAISTAALLIYVQQTKVEQVEFFLGWAQRLIDGNNPYGVPTGYPPLAMFALVVPGLGSPDVDTYKVTFALAMSLVSFAGLCVATYAERRLGRTYAAPAYIAAITVMGPHLLLARYDIVPAVLSLAALVAVLRGRGGWAAAAIGVGIAFKPYLLVLLPLLGVWELRRAAPERARRLGILAAWVVVPSLIALLAMAPIAGFEDGASAYGFQVTREATQDSGAGIIVATIEPLGFFQRVAFEPNCGCMVRTGEAMGVVRPLLTAALLATILALTALVWRRPDPERVVQASLAALGALIVGYAVFSPQYLLWLAVPICLLAGSRRGRVPVAAALLATLIAGATYERGYQQVIEFRSAGAALTLLRFAAELGCLLTLVMLMRADTATAEAAGDRDRLAAAA